MRNVCAGLPDKRGGRNIQYTMADIGMAAFSVFFVQSPSFLGHQRRLLEGRGRSNCQTLFAMTEIPSDNHIRAMLDPVSPDAFQPAFDAGIRALEAGRPATVPALRRSRADRARRHPIPPLR